MSYASLHPLRHVWSSRSASHFSLLFPRPTLGLLACLLGLILWALPEYPTQLAAFGTADAASARSTTEATAPAPEQTEPPALNPHMLGALHYAARKYRVSAEVLTPIFQTAQDAAEAARLDPLLVIAVIAVESGFNPFAQSTMGAQGLMQVIPRFHQEKLPEDAHQLSLFDPVVNVRVGTRVLHEYVRRHGDVASGLQVFAGAADDPGQGYASKVLAEKERLLNASRNRTL